MKKTYKNQLPKGMEVESTKVRVENGEVFVDVELKEKFQPKDGDFLVVEGSIFIYNPSYESLCVPFYVGMNSLGHIYVHEDGDSTGFGHLRDCRYATEKEKAAFLERIEMELGKIWNPEIKILEYIRWQPYHGEGYWYVNEDFVPIWDKFSNKNTDHIFRVKINNCFKTKEATQKVADQIKELFKNSKAE